MKWIKADEELPRDGQRCLIQWHRGGTELAYFCEEEGTAGFEWDGEYVPYRKIAFWFPLSKIEGGKE